MKRYILLSLLMTIPFLINGQNLISQPCGYDYYVKELSEKYPQFKEVEKRSFNRIENQSHRRTGDILTINVVVHIVYSNQEQNVSDSIVAEVISSINKDYRRKNTNADNVRPQFKNRVGDAKIEFKLHQVVHAETDTTFEFNIFQGLPDHVKQSSYGGSDAFNTEKFLNIWVCDMGDNLLGYAYPPAGLNNWPENTSAPMPGLDGVVINYKAFSAYDTIARYIQGQQDTMMLPVRARTITHEVGHYLGLRHIWGDGLAAIGIPACDEDDGIGDTPNSGLNAAFTCDTTLNTCTVDSLDEKDMIENYMDYSRETCQNSFTIGQISHMRAVLMNERYGLIDTASVNTVHLENKPVVSIYPNPAESYITVSIEGEIRVPARLELWDYSGRKIMEKTILSGERMVQFNVSEIPSGMYLMRLYDDTNINSYKVAIN